MTLLVRRNKVKFVVYLTISTLKQSQLCGTVGTATACNFSIQNELKFVSQLLHFKPNSLLMSPRKAAAADGPRTPATHVGDLEKVPCSWLQAGTALAYSSIWTMNQQMEELLYS